MSDARRWTLGGAPDGPAVAVEGPRVRGGEVAVMPVSEHEDAKREWAESILAHRRQKEHAIEVMADMGAELVRLRAVEKAAREYRDAWKWGSALAGVARGALFTALSEGSAGTDAQAAASPPPKEGTP
jgi:hypothetical protein